MARIDLNIAPHEEAAELIRSKPTVVREVFDRMLPEIRARAFVITGIHAADVLQRVRDRIAELPEGALWEDVKKDILREISPYLVSAQDPNERAREEQAASRRAELLVRTHAFQAYQACKWHIMQETKTSYPYWKYVTIGDDRVRPEHAALNGLVVPADSPFWVDHFPPWDWGCRCDVVPISPEAVDALRRADAEKPPEERVVVEGARLKRLERWGEISRGPIPLIDPNDPYRKKPMIDAAGNPIVLPARTWNVTAPAKKGRPGAWRWKPGDLRLPLDVIRSRYDDEVWDAFVNSMKSAFVDGVSVWDWLNGRSPVTVVGRKSESKKDPWDDALETLKLAGKQAWSRDEIVSFWDYLRKDNPVSVSEVLEKVSGWNYRGGILTDQFIRSAIQEIIERLPPALVRSLGKITVEVEQKLSGRALGLYDQTERVIKLNEWLHEIMPNPREEARKTIYHEVMHWVHKNAPKEYQEAIKNLFQERTSGEPWKYVSTYTNPIKEDKWYNVYAGTIYPQEIDDPQGEEVVTTHVELFAVPDYMERMMQKNNGETIVENLRTIMRIFFDEL